MEITGVQFHYSATTTFIELASTPCGYEISQEDAAWLLLDQAPQKQAGGRFPTPEAAQIAHAQLMAALQVARPPRPVRLWRALRRRQCVTENQEDTMETSEPTLNNLKINGMTFEEWIQQTIDLLEAGHTLPHALDRWIMAAVIELYYDEWFGGTTPQQLIDKESLLG